MFKRKDVYIEHGRSLDKPQKIIDILYRKNHIDDDGPVSTRATTYAKDEKKPPRYGFAHDQKEYVSMKVADSGVQLPDAIDASRKGPLIHPDRLKLIDRHIPPPNQ